MSTDASRRAFEITGELGFSLEERTRLLGYSEPVGDNPEYLQREVTVLGKGTDLGKRCNLLLIFDALLVKIGRTDAAAKRRFVETERYQCFDDKTFKEWMSDGDLPRLEYAVQQLRYMST